MGRTLAQPRHARVPERSPSYALVALAAILALVASWALVALPASPASATGGGNGSNPQCTTEYEWVKKGKEYRWKTVYKEAKQLKGWYVELPNTWKQGDPNTWYDLPSEKQPPRSDQVAPTGTVPLSVYGGPRNVSTQYQYKTSYTEFFPSETGFSAGPPPAGKDWGNPVAEQTVVVDGPKWAATSPGQGWEKTGKTQQVNCFDWNWKYDNPTCTALTVKYPANIPAGQANDVNVRIVNLGPGGGEVTLNFHNNNGTWSGTKSFVYAEHPKWPGWTYYKVVWTQVGGTNYHWQGEVSCGTPPAVKDASASVSADTAATCTATSSVKFDIVNATWDGEADLSVGTHTRTATAADGHLFADGTNKATVTYTIDDKKASQSTDPKGECYVPPTPKVCVAIENGPTATNLDEAGWNHNDTRNTGKYEYVNGGIRLHTTDTDNPGSSQNKVTLYRAVEPTLLSDFGEPSVVFADGGSGVKPGMQVGVDVNGDGTFDGYLVGEPWSYGEHNWWTNKAGFNVPSGMGYASFGSWADFVAANPQAKVVSVGLSLGSGVLGDWTVKSFTANCVTYTFDYVKPIVKDAVASVSEKEQPSCTATGTVDFTIENATWDGEADLSVGTHTRTATANDGHLFADGTNKATVTYTIADKLPEQSTDPSAPCYVEPPVKDAVFTAPTVIDVCGVDGDQVVLGESEDGTFKVTSVTPLDDGRIRHRVVFTPNDGFVVPEPGEGDTYELVDGKAVWKLYTTDEPCPPVEVPSNGHYSYTAGCYLVDEDMVITSPHITFTFTNAVDVKEGEVAKDAEFTYTDANGETQTVTVPANEVVVRTVVFPEDSGDHTVTVGLKGEEQETVTVPTDCAPNPVPFTPQGVTFTDKCGLTNDKANVPGTLVASSSSTDNLTGDVYRYEEYATDNGSYYVSYEQVNGKLDVEVWFVPNDPNAVPTAPGKDDTYTVEYGLAVWRYTFTNEACSTTPTPNPTVTPTSKPTTPATPPKTPTRGHLAETGSNVFAPLGAMGLLLLAGAGMVVIPRLRRKPTTDETGEL